MTQEQKEQLAEKFAVEACEETPLDYNTAKKVALNALNARDEEVERLEAKLAKQAVLLEERGLLKFANLDAQLEIELMQLRAELAKAKNPWITDRDPEIKGSISDAVLLLIDGMFYRVSRLERRKDGSEFWWGVDVANGEEVTAWMPIPPTPKGGEE